MTSLEQAQKYLLRGWQPIPIPHRSKNPGFDGWQNFATSENDLPNYFNGKSQNIGILLGAKSNGLTDIDLDSPEAVKIADYFLPKTESEFGRASMPRSHRLYICADEFSDKINNPFLINSPDKAVRDEACIVEFRGKAGLQTVFPGSTHKESGEAITWSKDGEPTQIGAKELHRAVALLTTACLISTFWRDGVRQDLTMAVGGALLRNGFDVPATKNFIRAVCAAANDEEISMRLKAVDATAEKLRHKENVYGFPKLAELTDKKLVETACKWLKIEARQAANNYDEGRYNVNNVNNVAEMEREIGYPKLSDAVFFGLAGELVKVIAPHTESDNAALLVQFLSGFGNLIGRGAHFRVGADAHYTKLNAVVVGATAAGRKGLSWGEVQRVLVRVDESFKCCIHGGLSSGEGLIHTVRDAQFKKTPVREKGRIVDYQDEMYDEGTSEKRAFVVESEFARVLKVSQREGNTLSQVIRDAWDKDFLQIKTKQAVAASNAHITIIGHITKEELLRTLADSDLTNGFANRFVWVCSRRSKYLPSGGNLSDLDINVLVTKIRRAVEFAKTAGEIKRDAEADALWCEVYRKLSDGHAGLLGSVTSRATAQVLRIACLYSLLDCSKVIRLDHLTAALALWRYCEDSARYIFGAQTGNKIADEIFAELQRKKGGMSKNDIREHFQQNRSAAEINIALELLFDLGRIDSYKEKSTTRPKEIFIALPNVINVINVISPEDESESDRYNVNNVNNVAESENKFGSEATELIAIGDDTCLHCRAEISSFAETCAACGGAQLPSF
jgi:hypothetical protein